jgi:hypothetical protein
MDYGQPIDSLTSYSPSNGNTLNAVSVRYVLLSGEGSRDRLRGFVSEIMPAFLG